MNADNYAFTTTTTSSSASCSILEAPLSLYNVSHSCCPSSQSYNGSKVTASLQRPTSDIPPNYSLVTIRAISRASKH
jgi:hypothetical protein